MMKTELPIQLVDVFKTWSSDDGFHFGADECPWIPGEAGTWIKFMLFDRNTNSHALLFKMEPGSTLKPHYHTQPVVGYTIQGEWKYKEYDWIARAGSTVYEPAGVVHNLINVGTKEPMISFFHVTGPEVVVDENGRFVEYIDANVLIHYTRDYCKSKGISDAFLKKITR